MKDSQITGANHTEGKSSGKIAPNAPSSAHPTRSGRESLIVRRRRFCLNTVAAKEQDFRQNNDGEPKVTVDRKSRFTAGGVHRSYVLCARYESATIRCQKPDRQEGPG